MRGCERSLAAISPTPLPARDYRPRRPPVLPFRHQRLGRRGDACGARDRGVLRDDPALVPHVRAPLRWCRARRGVLGSGVANIAICVRVYRVHKTTRRRLVCPWLPGDAHPGMSRARPRQESTKKSGGGVYRARIAWVRTRPGDPWGPIPSMPPVAACYPRLFRALVDRHRADQRRCDRRGCVRLAPRTRTAVLTGCLPVAAEGPVVLPWVPTLTRASRYPFFYLPRGSDRCMASGSARFCQNWDNRLAGSLRLCFSCSLPRYSGGSASAPSLSGPAQASLALRPTTSLSRPRRPLSQRLRPSRLPALPARQLPELIDNSLGGSSLHW